MRIYFLFFGALLLSLVSCGGDAVAEQQNLLIGHWDLIEGQRNGKVTESLRDTYFEFTSDGKMSTNLPIKGGIDSPYVIEDGAIVQTIINELQIRYKIVELTPKALKLTTKLRGFDFVFDLEKGVQQDADALSLVEGIKTIE